MGALRMDYKKIIIDLLERVEDERFLQQLYTIVIRHIRRNGGISDGI
jgi:hypothetical protein